MSKLYYLIALFATLCLSSAYAQTESRVLSIEDLFRLADENNRSMRAYSTATAEARENVKSAKKACLPSIDASLSVNYNGNGTITDRNFANAFAAPIPHFGNNFAIEVSQVVFSGGAISSGVKIAELKQQIAVLNAEKNRQEVRFLIAGNYLELCKMQNQLQVFESNIAQTKKVLDNMHSKVNEGVALNNDITRYELQLQNLNYNKIQLENSLLLLNNQLTVATGLPQTVIIVPDTAFVKTLQATSLRQKPDHSAALSLQMAEKTEKIISQAEKIVHAERLPQIAFYVFTLTLGYILLLVAGLWMSRLLKHHLMEDVFNEENESFMQETRLLENEYSVNLPTKFQYRGKLWNGWINVVNPFRASIVLETPGSGKSYAVVNNYIKQHIQKSMFLRSVLILSSVL